MTTLKDMENSQKELKHELMKICWFMRGGVTYDEANTMSPQEREIIGQLVKDNMEDQNFTFFVEQLNRIVDVSDSMSKFLFAVSFNNASDLKQQKGR